MSFHSSALYPQCHSVSISSRFRLVLVNPSARIILQNMAVFKLNICKFNNCDLMFNNLENLIRHIETSHIDYDPKIIEQFETQQPTCLPLSYVLKFYADTVEELDETNSKLKQTLLSPKSTIVPQHKSYNNASGQCEMANIETSYNNNHVREKNVSVKTNKTHKINAYKTKKSYKCHCGKTHNSGLSLKKHAFQCHNAAAVAAQTKEIAQQDSETYNELVQPSISLKQFSAPGVPLKTLVVSTKSTTTSTTSTVDQQCTPSQRIMIQISNMNDVASYSS